MENAIKSTVVFKTVKTKTLATIGAIIAAVALPQLLHIIGLVSNMGTALGETFLPMHIAILLVGLLGGGTVGFISGMLAPLISFALTGMPTVYMLPFMMIELAFYGLICGLLANKNMPTLAKLLIAQIGGRMVRAVFIVGAFYLLGSKIAPSVIWTSIAAGLPGLILQWALIPLLIYYINTKSQNGESPQTKRS